MSKLETLLLKINEVKTLTEQQTDEALSTALQTKVQNFVEESLSSKKDNSLVKEDASDYEEEVVGDVSPETSLSNDDSIVPTDVDGTEGSSDDVDSLNGDGMDASTMAPDTTDDASGELGATADDDEVLDLRHASLEEVMEKLSQLPDGTVIEIVKNKPTYDVKASEDLTVGGDGTETVTEDKEECDDDEINEWIETALKESANQSVVDEYKTLLEQYEQKLANMEKAHAKELKTLTESLNESKREVKTLKEEQSKYNDALNQSSELLEQLAVHNTNLLHITKLFTEQTVNKNEKVEIARQFDSVKTINESKILFEALSKTLPKKESANDVQELKEEMMSQNNKKEIIKEEKTFNDPDFIRFDQLVGYKI